MHTLVIYMLMASVAVPQCRYVQISWGLRVSMDKHEVTEHIPVTRFTSKVPHTLHAEP